MVHHQGAQSEKLTDFIDLIRKFKGTTSVNDITSDEVAGKYIIATFIALRKCVLLDELEAIRTGLPQELKWSIYHHDLF